MHGHESRPTLISRVLPEVPDPRYPGTMQSNVPDKDQTQKPQCTGWVSGGSAKRAQQRQGAPAGAGCAEHLLPGLSHAKLALMILVHFPLYRLASAFRFHSACRTYRHAAELRCCVYAAGLLRGAGAAPAAASPGAQRCEASQRARQVESHRRRACIKVSQRSRIQQPERSWRAEGQW